MIKIIEINCLDEYKIELTFSTYEKGILDFKYLLSKKTELTKPLENNLYFRECFIELGALAWKNGLELSPKALYEKLVQNKALIPLKISA